MGGELSAKHRPQVSMCKRAVAAQPSECTKSAQRTEILTPSLQMCLAPSSLGPNPRNVTHTELGRNRCEP